MKTDHTPITDSIASVHKSISDFERSLNAAAEPLEESALPAHEPLRREIAILRQRIAESAKLFTAFAATTADALDTEAPSVPSHDAGLRFMDGLNLGKGLVAAEDIPAGTILFSFAGAETAAEKDMYSVQVGTNRHVNDYRLAALNHSCSPTLFIDAEKMHVIASRDIAASELLTFFYPSTEWEMAEPFQCQCSHEACVGFIAGAKTLDSETLSRHFINPHILQLVEGNP